MLAPNLALLFMPIPHTNAVTWLTGVSRNRLIRFHRRAVPRALFGGGWGTTRAGLNWPRLGPGPCCRHMAGRSWCPCAGPAAHRPPAHRRWIGHWTLWLVAAHSVGYYIYWAATSQ